MRMDACVSSRDWLLGCCAVRSAAAAYRRVEHRLLFCRHAASQRATRWAQPPSHAKLVSVKTSLDLENDDDLLQPFSQLVDDPPREQARARHDSDWRNAELPQDLHTLTAVTTEWILYVRKLGLKPEDQPFTLGRGLPGIHGVNRALGVLLPFTTAPLLASIAAVTFTKEKVWDIGVFLR